jgi:hypothetical protein
VWLGRGRGLTRRLPTSKGLWLYVLAIFRKLKKVAKMEKSNGKPPNVFSKSVEVNLYFSLCFTSLFLAILTTVSKYEKLPGNGHGINVKVKNDQTFKELACMLWRLVLTSFQNS